MNIICYLGYKYQKLLCFLCVLFPHYSFQEPLKEEEEDEKDPNPPMMVPVADLLNHVANHNANLEYASGCLKMVCVRAIHRGEEVFNTYGELANWQLLHMYGFAEPFPTNTNDAVDIQMMTVFKAALQAAKTEEEQNLVHEKWHLLCQLEMVGEEGAFVIGQSEVLTEEELHTTLKVLTMSVEDFTEFKESEGWEEEDEDACTLSHNKIQKLKPSWKQLLHSSILLTLQAFSSDLEADKCLINDQKAYRGLSKIEKYALHVRYGQKMLLHKLLQLSSC
ncbi:N-lysine methyltransferase SETD6 [Protopterus annectens]|uniref:N-lysine methyltransferase SETD6 n=1 Tax=Protopterus annectens TaxID=7888 RepID=UPI001CF9D269|nr:N-lysine methyltransferase SETD6 [Protopterus annectens]